MSASNYDEVECRYDQVLEATGLSRWISRAACLRPDLGYLSVSRKLPLQEQYWGPYRTQWLRATGGRRAARKYLTGAEDDYTLHLRPISSPDDEAHGERVRNYVALVLSPYDSNGVLSAPT